MANPRTTGRSASGDTFCHAANAPDTTCEPATQPAGHSSGVRISGTGSMDRYFLVPYCGRIGEVNIHYQIVRLKVAPILPVFEKTGRVRFRKGGVVLRRTDTA